MWWQTIFIIELESLFKIRYWSSTNFSNCNYLWSSCKKALLILIELQFFWQCWRYVGYKKQNNYDRSANQPKLSVYNEKYWTSKNINCCCILYGGVSYCLYLWNMKRLHLEDWNFSDPISVLWQEHRYTPVNLCRCKVHHFSVCARPESASVDFVPDPRRSAAGASDAHKSRARSLNCQQNAREPLRSQAWPGKRPINDITWNTSTPLATAP